MTNSYNKYNAKLYWSLHTKNKGDERITTNIAEEFPMLYSIQHSAKNKDSFHVNNLQIDSVFWQDWSQAIGSDSERIFIVDRFFDQSCYLYFKEKICQSPSCQDCNLATIHVLTSYKPYKDITRLTDNQIQFCSKFIFHCLGENNFSNCNIHDRFILIGDHFWHFGSTVGSLYQSFSLTAFSGPWKDVNGEMSKSLYPPIKPRLSEEL